KALFKSRHGSTSPGGASAPPFLLEPCFSLWALASPCRSLPCKRLPLPALRAGSLARQAPTGSSRGEVYIGGNSGGSRHENTGRVAVDESWYFRPGTGVPADSGLPGAQAAFRADPRPVPVQRQGGAGRQHRQPVWLHAAIQGAGSTVQRIQR